LDDFAAFQDSQGTHRAYLAERAELAYNRRNEKGKWGLALGTQASMIDITPLDKVISPFKFFISLLLMVWGGF
jgi:hypothetical protein